jgi:lysozyme family protein
MSSSFDAAIPTVFLWEGTTYENDPNDKGGETCCGIVWTDLNSAISHGIVPAGTTILTLSKSQAADIYKAFYWNALNLSRILTQSIATKILDVSVNVGLHWGVVLLQRAVRASTEYTLDEDGELGEKTIHAVNEAIPGCLLAAYRSEAAAYHRAIVINHPNQEEFLDGWLIRSYA